MPHSPLPPDKVICLINIALYSLYYADGDSYAHLLNRKHLWHRTLAADMQRYTPMLEALDWILKNPFNPVLQIIDVPFSLEERLKYIHEVKNILESNKSFFEEMSLSAKEDSSDPNPN